MTSASVWNLFWKGFARASHELLGERTLLIRLRHDEE